MAKAMADDPIMPSRHAVTIVEILVALSILAILASIAWYALRPTLAARSAHELSRVVRHARWLAVTSGVPAMLLTPDYGGSIVLVSDSAWQCDPDVAPQVRRVWRAPPRRLAVSWPVRGIAFAPDGFPRSCRGDGVGSATASLRDDTTAAAVIVSSLGRVRWERRSP